MTRDNQITGNVALYYVCYHLSLLGWNVMPTSRNAKGVDILAYNQDASRTLTIQVKSGRALNAVGFGKTLTGLIADFIVVCLLAQPEKPVCFVLTREEARGLIERDAGKKGEDKRQYWLPARNYAVPAFREQWNGFRLAQEAEP